MAAAADEGIDNPNGWTEAHRWRYAVSPGWADSWLYAEENMTVNDNPDIGARDDVINDATILSAVQTLIAEDAGGSA